MKRRFSWKWLLAPLILGLMIVGILGFRLAYEHKGFFIYHYSLLTHKTYASYQDELLALTKQDPKLALARYREILAQDPLSYNTCHGIAHQMGHAAFEAFGFQTAMAAQDGLCGGGYIHGIIEARFGLLQEKDIIKELPTICDEDNRSCYHGIGHGLMVATKLNITQSLTYCDLLPELGRRNCYDGVWMHIFDLEESGAPHEHMMDAMLLPSASVVAQRVSLCAQAGEAYKTSCYFYLPRIYAHASEVEFTDFVKLCSGVEAAYQTVCAAGTGHSIMKYHIAEPQVPIATCAQFSTAELSGACKEGGFLYYLFSVANAAKPAESQAAQTAACKVFENAADQSLCKKVTSYRGEL